MDKGLFAGLTAVELSLLQAARINRMKNEQGGRVCRKGLKVMVCEFSRANLRGVWEARIRGQYLQKRLSVNPDKSALILPEGLV
jgi:hypothetical protein